MSATSYYKLTLSYDDIANLISTTTDITIHTKLAKMIKKIDADLLKPAYIKENKPKINMLESLGGEIEETEVDGEDLYKNDTDEDWYAADPNITKKMDL